jgi:hypothetical protein
MATHIFFCLFAFQDSQLSHIMRRNLHPTATAFSLAKCFYAAREDYVPHKAVVQYVYVY